jgi:hypothetical protein
VDVDVVVYGTQTSGLAAVRELAAEAPHLRIALISSGDYLQSPLAQGLSAEDARNPTKVAGGFYREWRQAVIRTYAYAGASAFNESGRLVYEPEVAAAALLDCMQGNWPYRVTFVTGRLMAASDRPGESYVDVAGTAGAVRITTRYFIDASTEADLARALGCDYRLGRDESVYNDVSGTGAPRPDSDNDWVTAPQRYSALLTLQLHDDGAALSIATQPIPGYDPSTYAGTELSETKVEAFAKSWTMTIAVLPNNKRELNETWNDWSDVGLSFRWVFEPEGRNEMRDLVAARSVNLVRYLQEHGYPELGIATVPQYLYVREGPRIVGLDTYTAGDVVEGAVRQPVAIGCYCEYDRHDAFAPNQIDTTRYVHVPMGALLPIGHPTLVVSTAVSTDYIAYCSAVRMEHTRAHMGAAAGLIVAVADMLGVEPGKVPYGTLRAKLRERGYRLDPVE